MFDREEKFDAAALEPMITYGTNPGMGIPIGGKVPEPANATAAKALAYMGLSGSEPLLGRKIDVVFIGSCTNSRLSDLRAAAGVFKGRKVADGVRALVVPGSQAIKLAAEAEGLDRVFREAGRRVARGRLFDVHRDERRSARARAVRGQHQQPQLRGAAGRGRPHLPRQPGHRRRRRRHRPDHRRAASSSPQED